MALIERSLSDSIVMTDSIGYRLNPDQLKPLQLDVGDPRGRLVVDDLRGQLDDTTEMGRLVVE